MKELRDMSSEDLSSKQRELKKELMQLRSEAASGTLPENPGRIGAIKKTIARIKTIQTEEEAN